jgi:hypothetical protein
MSFAAVIENWADERQVPRKRKAFRQDQLHILFREVLPLFARVRLRAVDQAFRGIAGDLFVLVGEPFTTIQPPAIWDIDNR